MEIVYQYGALAAGSQALATAQKSMDSELDAVETSAIALMSSWSSEAQQAYVTRQGEWRTAAGNIIQMLGGNRDAVDQSSEAMAHTEKFNTNRFS